MRLRESSGTAVRAFVVAAAIIGLVGCSAESGDDGAPPSIGAFPITIEHGLGDTVIDSAPERIVTLGAADTQIASALDAHIVGSVANPGAENKNWPSVEPALSGGATSLDSVEPDMEKILSFEPDLILATSAQPAILDHYERLSEIAPVIAFKKEHLQDSGEVLTRLIGQALGKEQAAEELIEESDAKIAEFVEEHKYLEGKKYVFGQYAGQPYLVVGPRSQSAQFMSRIGLEIPDELIEMYDEDSATAGASLGMINPSSEKLDRIDAADIGFFSAYGEAAQKQFSELPLVANSSLLADGKLKFIDLNLAAALLQPNPATTEYVLDSLRSDLETLK